MSLTIDVEKIARVDSMKYLGVEIDEKLNFKQHVDTTLKKMAKKVGFLGRIQQKLIKTAKITICNSIISPHLDSLPLQRKGFESPPSDTKQGNEDNSVVI
jgi:hypothetical protein